MKKKIRAAALMRLFAIVLCAALSFAYLPMSGLFGGKAFALEESNWRADNVSSITFNPVGGAERFVLIAGVDFDTSDDAIHFEDGDEIVATLENGAGKRTLKCVSPEDDESYWLIKETGEKLMTSYEVFDGEEYVDEIYITPWVYRERDEETDEEIPFEIGSNNKFRICFGKNSSGEAVFSAWKTFTVLENPVTKVEFEKSANSDPERFVFYEGEDYYSVDFIEGDKLIVTNNGVKKTYTFDENKNDFYCGAEVLPERYGTPWFDEGDQEEWVVGETAQIQLRYAGHAVDVAVEVKASPVESIEFDPVKKEYSAAELLAIERVYEDYGYDEDDNETITYTYEYELEEFNEGDKLTIKLEGEDAVVYTYKEVEDNESWLAFADENGKVLQGWPENLRFKGEKIDVPEGESKDYQFGLKYKGKTALVDITVRGSSDAEIALEKAKEEAREALYAIDDKYQIDEKLANREYRDAQIEQLHRAWDKAMNAIENAKTIQAVQKAVAEYEAVIKSVKTDAQLKAEEAAAKKAADELKEWNGTLNSKIPAVKKAKFKAAKKKVTVNWTKANKKNLKKFTHVEVQVCKDKKFQKSNTKRVVVKKTKKSATVKGLKKGTYFVRVRNVKGSGTGKLVSKWSKVKKIKVK